ncbi:MAG: hypothetical protein WB507_14995 [Solirubrobacterales bacterium]
MSSAGDEKNKSVLYAVFVFMAFAIAIAGAVIAVIGLGSPTAISVEGDGYTVKTTSAGLLIFVVGMVLAGALILKKPNDITFADRATAPSRSEALLERLSPAYAFAPFAIGVVLLIVSLATE